MIAVFEEVNGEFAVFLIEDLSKIYNLHLSQLPPNAKPGDLFKVRFNSDYEMKFEQKLVEETERRKERNRLKREALKRRSNSKK